MLRARVLSGLAGWMPEIRRCRRFKVARAPGDLARYRDLSRRPSYRKAMMERAEQRGASGTGENEWFTPAEYDWELLDDAVVAEWRGRGGRNEDLPAGRARRVWRSRGPGPRLG
jgi:hypothetical protein